MKQIAQSLKNGETRLVDVPVPVAGRGEVLIQTVVSLVSPGTERMLIDFGKAGWIDKARQQPDKVKQVLDKMKTDGVGATLNAVQNKLDTPIPLGYCNAGRVVEVGSDVTGVSVGELVVSNGPHAEFVCVPENLVAKVPDGVGADEAVFTVLGSIALQGMRLAQPTLGESFVVFGMGVIGLLTVQLLRANGCKVLAVDINDERLAMAEKYGAEIVNAAKGDPVNAAESWTGGVGVDGALITAASSSDEIVHQAAQACRKRGRIVLVGVVGLNLKRDDFYKKELSFQVSCSYGPGRYDSSYEQGGNDYPIGYVRWTEKRNFEAVLEQMRSGALCCGDMISHRFSIDNALDAYDKVQNDKVALGLMLEYGEQDKPIERAVKREVVSAPVDGAVRVGVIGSGTFCKAVLLPAIQASGAELAAVVSKGGLSAAHAGERFDAGQVMSDYHSVLEDASIDAVVITTQHNLHARMVVEAVNAGKHVFVEKPLCLNEEELAEIASLEKSTQLMVGFNRRFSPHVARLKDALKGRVEPLCMSMTVNAGAIPADHWTQDLTKGGGRIVGEGCHFVDLLSFVAGSPVAEIKSVMVGEGPEVRTDKVAMVLSFEDGSVGTISYFANGSKKYPKERLEAFSDGRTAVIDNFRKTEFYGFKGLKVFKTRGQDKGHAAEMKAFVDAVKNGGPAVIPFEQIENVTRVSFGI